MDDKLKAVLDKIAKLRALAAKAGTQAEAETAAAQAAALIAKYQIDETQVEVADPSKAEAVAEGDHLWTDYGPKKGWLSLLASGLADLHGCAVVRFRRLGTSVYRIAGRPSDVAIVRYLFAWLRAEIERLAQSEQGRAAKNAFRLGAAAGVIEAMGRARKQETAAVAATGAAIVLASRSETSMAFFEAEAAKAGQKIRTAAAPNFSDTGALRRGVRAGEQLAPKQALSEGMSVPMLQGGR